jgi:DNA mismatch endonuclease (patch repair protein)
MADRVSVEKRSAIMRAVRSANTIPELVVRSAAHRLGLRFRLHAKALPGKPDLVFPRRGVAVFVNGCYWHRHPNCQKASRPKSNTAFWTAKFNSNVARDKKNYAALRRLGWQVVIVWQCEVKNRELATETLTKRFRACGLTLPHGAKSRSATSKTARRKPQ